MVKSRQLILKYIHSTILNYFVDIPSIISLKSLIKRVTVQSYEVNARLVICWWELLYSEKSTNSTNFQYHYVCANQLSYYYISISMAVSYLKSMVSKIFFLLSFLYLFSFMTVLSMEWGSGQWDSRTHN